MSQSDATVYSGERVFLADACAEIPSPEVVRYSLLRLAAIGYLDRFSGYLRQLGLTREAVDELIGLDPASMLDTLRVIGAEQGWLDDPTAHLRANGVSLVVAVSEAGLDPEAVKTPPPEQLIDWYADLPVDARLWVGVSPHDSSALARARHLRDHHAFAGISISPFLVDTPIDDAAYRPVLAWASDAGVPIWMHCSAHYRVTVPYDISHPGHLDAALRRFPTLRVLIGHAGWPWTSEYAILALRHPGLALELSTFPPRLLTEHGWGLSPLLAQRRALSGRVFFGSGSVFSETNYRSLIGQIDNLGIGTDARSWKGEGLRVWLGGSG
jgi:predicted TIM-barrel fold metal-dependent hydrolase